MAVLDAEIGFVITLDIPCLELYCVLGHKRSVRLVWCLL